MDYLTSSQIADYNNPMAFARKRTANVSLSTLGSLSSASSRRIRTDDIEASYRLVLGANSRLETLEGNLNTMLDLAKSGARARGNERKIEEYYGKIRSLSAGFDQVVEAIRFKDEAIFTERPIELNMGPGVRDLKLDPIRLLTYGENSLNLTEGVASADIQINYFVDDNILNSGYDLIGLDVEEASYISGSNPALELETGTYKLDIEYAGANSSVSIKNRQGELIEMRRDVDLSGSGREWVDFDSGIRLSFDKESVLQSIDKYDFETKGPAHLSATMSYERIEKQVVRTDENASGVENAQFLVNSKLQIGATSLEMSEPKVAPITAGKTPLATGKYNLEVEYRGEDSVIRVTDNFGRLKAYQYGIDLTAQGAQEIDMGNGFSFTLNNDNFNTIGAKQSTTLDYSTEGDAIDEFNFRTFQKRVEEAITIIAEQKEIIANAQSKIEEVNQLRNSAGTGAAPNANTLNASSAANLLSGGGGIGIFASVSSSARFGILSTQLFQTTTALPSQANQSPQALAQITKNGSSASLLSTFL